MEISIETKWLAVATKRDEVHKLCGCCLQYALGSFIIDGRARINVCLHIVYFLLPVRLLLKN